ncbi:MAG TPA: hypothetical protein VFM46_07930, partial [Pseudomonadales bacterium]|nr:hypothetical protein [Pseudomonadales bacterium]
ASNPAQILREMARVTRLGGAVLALAEPDYGGRIDFPAELATLGRWQAEALQAQGADPQMGRKLAGLFASAGIKDVETGVMGGEWRMPLHAEERAMEWAVLESDLTGHFPESDIQKLKELDITSTQSGARILFVPTFYAWGHV